MSKRSLAVSAEPAASAKAPRPDRWQQLAPVVLQTVLDNQGAVKGVNRYVRLEALGQGSFAKCFHVKSPSGRNVAMKVIDRACFLEHKNYNRSWLDREIAIHKSLTHDNIIKFEKHFHDDVFFYIVMELATNNVSLYIYFIS